VSVSRLWKLTAARPGSESHSEVQPWRHQLDE
jgi:hypothetical protein